MKVGKHKLIKNVSPLVSYILKYIIIMYNNEKLNYTVVLVYKTISRHL